MTPLLAGFATVDWTPEPGLRLLGQMHQRIATHTRDPLQAVACALAHGETEVVLVTVDVCMLDDTFITEVKTAWAAASGLKPESLLIHATHTHVAPALTGVVMEEPEPEAVAAVRAAILGAATEARASREPVDGFAGTGYCEELGWNRRAMFENGETRMYATSAAEGFIGLEGPRDGAAPVIHFKNLQGEIVGVLTGFAMHPNCLEGERFYSADFPGVVRKNLRRILGEQATVLYFTGAAGDTAPSILDPAPPVQPWRGEAGVERSGLYFAGEVAKVVATPTESMKPSLRVESRRLEIPMRPWPHEGEPTYTRSKNEYYMDAERDWPAKMAAESPFPVSVHAVRIGDAVIVTNPAELFVAFGMEIREGSPARTTLVAELSDGYCGYVPTGKAFGRGGYETWCAPSSRLVGEAGREIVAASLKSIKKVFSG